VVGGLESEAERKVKARETREGWPLLTVETEVNWDSRNTTERGPSMVGSLGMRFLFCLGCFSRPNTKYFSLTVHYFNSFVSIAQQVGGRQLCWIACLLV
jgi:hypothetical protein